LVKVPPEVAVRATIRPGSVYYFPYEHFSSPEPHYFVVVNIDPTSEELILLVYSTSQISKVKRRYRDCPDETLVEISPHQYPNFKKVSVLDCNYVIKQTIDQIIERLSNEQLKLMPEMPIELVEQLRQGILASPHI
jgi:hypothetical protein